MTRHPEMPALITNEEEPDTYPALDFSDLVHIRRATVLRVEHDPWCPAQDGKPCACCPEVWYEPISEEDA